MCSEISSGPLTYFVASLSRNRVPVRHWEPQCFSKGKRELFLEIFRHVSRQGSKCSSLRCLWGYFGNGSKEEAAPMFSLKLLIVLTGSSARGGRSCLRVSPGGQDQATL